MSREYPNYFTVVGVKAGKQGICLVYRNECAQVEQWYQLSISYGGGELCGDAVMPNAGNEAMGVCQPLIS